MRILEEARVAVLLLSPSYLASPVIYEEEVPTLLAAVDSGRIRLLCVYLWPSVIKHVEFHYRSPNTGEDRRLNLTQFKGVNDERPLSGLSEHDLEVELVHVAEVILDAVLPTQDELANLLPGHWDVSSDLGCFHLTIEPSGSYSAVLPTPRSGRWSLQGRTLELRDRYADMKTSLDLASSSDHELRWISQDREMCWQRRPRS